MFFLNSDHSFIVIFFVKLEAYRGLILVKTVCSGHIRLFSYGLKRYRPIRLHGSSNCNREFRSRFQMQISRERKEQTDILLNFLKDQRRYFQNALNQILTIFTPSH